MTFLIVIISAAIVLGCVALIAEASKKFPPTIEELPLPYSEEKAYAYILYEYYQRYHFEPYSSLIIRAMVHKTIRRNPSFLWEFKGLWSTVQDIQQVEQKLLTTFFDIAFISTWEPSYDENGILSSEGGSVTYYVLNDTAISLIKKYYGEGAQQ